MRTGHVASFPDLVLQATKAGSGGLGMRLPDMINKTIVVSDVPQPTVNRSLVFSISLVHVNSSPMNGVQTCL